MVIPDVLQEFKSNLFAERESIEQVDFQSPEFSFTTTDSNTQNQSTEKDTAINTVSFFTFLKWIYVAGLVFFFCRFLIQLIGVGRLLAFAERVKGKGYNIAFTNREVSTFSFFNWIVADLNAAPLTEEVLIHESIHMRQWHSLDILFAEMCCIVFWFNPFAWLNNKFTKLNLEYIADQKTLEILPDAKAYQYNLLHHASGKNQFSITNHFNQSTIKNRIAMINRKPSLHLAKAKYLSIVPLVVLFIMSFGKELLPVKTNDEQKNMYILVTKKTTLSQLENIQKELAEYKINFTWDLLQFSNKGEIESISINLKIPTGNNCNSSVTGDFLVFSAFIKDSGKGSFGCSSFIADQIPFSAVLELKEDGGVFISSGNEDSTEYGENFEEVEKYKEELLKQKMEWYKTSCKIPPYFLIDDSQKTLEIPCVEDSPNNTLTIFNKWGDKVFNQKNYNNSWEGTQGGNDLENGSYFFVFKKENESKSDQGYLVINRGKCAVPNIILADKSKSNTLEIPCALNHPNDELIIKNVIGEIIYQNTSYKNDWEIGSEKNYRYSYRRSKDEPFAEGVIKIE